MDKERAWKIYFSTGDSTPLIEAYWKTIHYMAWVHNSRQVEDTFQVGMMGLLKALRTLKVERMKSLDAWIYLNVRSAMRNMRKFKQDESLDDVIYGLAHVDNVDDSLTIKDSLDTLPKREALILRLIGAGYKRTEIGEMFGLSSMRIGQLEKRALKQIAHQ